MGIIKLTVLLRRRSTTGNQVEGHHNEDTASHYERSLHSFTAVPKMIRLVSSNHQKASSCSQGPYTLSLISPIGDHTLRYSSGRSPSTPLA